MFFFWFDIEHGGILRDQIATEILLVDANSFHAACEISNVLQVHFLFTMPKANKFVAFQALYSQCAVGKSWCKARYGNVYNSDDVEAHHERPILIPELQVWRPLVWL